MFEITRTPTLEAATSAGEKKFWLCTLLEAGGRRYLSSHAWMLKRGGSPSEIRISEPAEVLGKNLGKSNATDSLSQAHFELNQKLRKKLDEGYTDPLATQGGDSSKAWIPPLLPMLAHPYEDRKHTVDWSSNPIVQAKLDGQRTLYQSGQFWTRQGKQLDSQISAHLKMPEYADGCIYDGELMLPSPYTFQDTMRAIKKYRAELTPLLEYHVYDQYMPLEPELGFALRYDLLSRKLDMAGNGVKLVKNHWVSSEAEMFYAHSSNLLAGFEGSILRSHNAPYKVGHRSVDLLKVKNFQDAEYRVTGYSQGRGQDSSAILFECITEGGKTFDVRPAWSLERRREAFSRAQTYLGQWLTVRFFELSHDAIPRFPVGVDFKPDRQD